MQTLFNQLRGHILVILTHSCGICAIDYGSTAAHDAARQSAQTHGADKVIPHELCFGVSCHLVCAKVQQVGDAFFARLGDGLFEHVHEAGLAAGFDDVYQVIQRDLFGQRFNAAGHQATGQRLPCVYALLTQLIGLACSGFCAHQSQGRTGNNGVGRQLRQVAADAQGGFAKESTRAGGAFQRFLLQLLYAAHKLCSAAVHVHGLVGCILECVQLGDHSVIILTGLFIFGAAPSILPLGQIEVAVRFRDPLLQIAFLIGLLVLVSLLGRLAQIFDRGRGAQTDTLKALAHTALHRRGVDVLADLGHLSRPVLHGLLFLCPLSNRLGTRVAVLLHLSALF